MKQLRVVLIALLFAATTYVAASPALHGTWSGDDFVIVLNGDGSGTMSDSAWTPPEPLRWSATSKTLTVVQDGEPVDYDYTLKGNRLHVAGGDLDEAIDLTRGGAAAAANQGAAQSPVTSSTPRSGSCDASCRHYMQCVGSADIQAYVQCTSECAAAGYEASFLGWFESSDCLSAVAVVEALQEQQRGFDGGGQQGGQSSNSQCDGCVWDGNECAWYSQSNWGSNVAYSGAVISCDAGCCR